MATLRLTKVKADGSGFPDNTTPEFRFDHQHIDTITVPEPDVWVNFPSNATLHFNGSGNINLYMGGGVYVDTSSTSINETPVTNKQLSVSCAYGRYYVRYNVT